MSSQTLYRVLLCNGTGTHYVRTAGPDGAMQVVNTTGPGAETMPPPLPIGEAEVMRRDAARWWGPYRFELEWAGEAPLTEDECDAFDLYAYWDEMGPDAPTVPSPGEVRAMLRAQGHEVQP